MRSVFESRETRYITVQEVMFGEKMVFLAEEPELTINGYIYIINKLTLFD